MAYDRFFPCDTIVFLGIEEHRMVLWAAHSMIYQQYG